MLILGIERKILNIFEKIKLVFFILKTGNFIIAK